MPTPGLGRKQGCGFRADNIQEWKVASLKDADADPGKTATHLLSAFLFRLEMVGFYH